MADPRRVGVLISGRGSNLRALAEQADGYSIVLVVSNKAQAAGLDWARGQGFATWCWGSNGIERTRFDDALSQALEDHEVGTVALAGYMRENPTVGIAGPRLLNPDGSLQPSRRRFPTLATALIESTPLQQWFPNTAPLRRYYMLDRADDIELVDMPQDELLAKFTDSKINVPDYMKNCARDFYRKGNLTALREIALRKLAKRVNLQLTDYMHQRNVHGPWKTNDRILVAIDAGIHAEELIRMATHMAMSLEGQWYAVHVRDNSPLTNSDEMQLKRNFMLVRELGGELIATADTDIAEGILRTARQKNASQIIVGKSTRNRFFRIFRRGSIVDRLIEKSGSIDIHVVENRGNGPDHNSSRPWFRRFLLDRHYLIT
jgi:nucleotide-binding universal stress UspA family protein